MADGSKIEWCDATWNPVRGCTRVSPGCGGPNHEGGCYAEKVAARFSGAGQPYEGFAERTPHGGRWTGKIALIEGRLDLPLRWRRPRRIFVNSMSDLFHEDLPDEVIDRVFAVMAMAPQHTFQVLTKRAARMRGYLAGLTRQEWWKARLREAAGRPMTANNLYPDWPLPNVWLGTSVEDQARADERIPAVLATPAAKRFISAEPLLGPIDARVHLVNQFEGPDLRCVPCLDWVIVGGESGPRSRPMRPDWARSLRDQCQAAGVPYFFKQWGEWAPIDDQPSEIIEDFDVLGLTADGVYRAGKHAAGRLLDGREWSEFPA